MFVLDRYSIVISPNSQFTTDYRLYHAVCIMLSQCENALHLYVSKKGADISKVQIIPAWSWSEVNACGRRNQIIAWYYYFNSTVLVAMMGGYAS